MALLNPESLWRGGYAGWRGTLAGLLAGPLVAVLLIWLCALAYGLQGDYDGPRVIAFLVREGLLVSVMGNLLFVLPAFLILAHLKRAGLLTLALASGLLTLFFCAPLQEHQDGSSAVDPLLRLEFFAAVAVIGPAAGAAFWLAARRFGKP